MLTFVCLSYVLVSFIIIFLFLFFFLVYVFFSFFFFFFQAEDGIRDTSVTGVQTCALPICTLSAPDQEELMSYRIAGIDVHKKMLAVVVSEVEIEGAYEFERRMFGSSPDQLRSLAAWLLEQQIEEVVMESTAQYWKPVWGALERYWKPICQKREGAGPMSGALHLAQAQSNRGRQGGKNDFADAERLVKRMVAQELILSFVPDPEQRLWRTVMRTKYQLTCNRVRLQNRLEALLEEAHIKLSSLVSDLLGASARRMLKALGNGETDPAALAALANYRLRATQEQLGDALAACQELSPVYRP